MPIIHTNDVQCKDHTINHLIDSNFLIETETFKIEIKKAYFTRQLYPKDEYLQTEST